MKYAEYTFCDSNPIKRFVQRRRLLDALSCAEGRYSSGTIVDFGGGNGEFCKLLAERFMGANIICYEPCSWLREEAQENLADRKNVAVVPSFDTLPKGQCSLLFCNEVFEHFPPQETEEAIRQIKELLRADGIAVIGVPIEIYLPALFKGWFRMSRRYGRYDARPSTVYRAFLGFPQRDRPIGDMGPGLRFHIPHTGFDHRILRKRLQRDFTLIRTKSSPIWWLGALFNNEIFFVLQNPGETAR
jgi:SAM-dependent methyltransferase